MSLRRLLIALPFLALALHVWLGYRDAGPSLPAGRTEAATPQAQAARLADLQRQESEVAPRPGQPNLDPRLTAIAGELAALAEAGNATAAWRLGWYALQGWGLERDRCSATAFFFQAARAGQANAQFWLAMAYLPPNGQGVAPDKLAAFRWASAARDQGLPIARELFFFFTRDLSPAERQAAEASLQDWSPATAEAPAIRRYPYVPVLVGLWPRQRHHVMPCRQDEAPLERWDEP